MPACRVIESRDVRLHVETWGDIQPMHGGGHTVTLRSRLVLACPFCLLRTDGEFPGGLSEVEIRVRGFVAYHSQYHRLSAA